MKIKHLTLGLIDNLYIPPKKNVKVSQAEMQFETNGVKTSLAIQQTSKDTRRSVSCTVSLKESGFVMFFSKYLRIHNGTYPQRESALLLPSCFCSKWVCRVLKIKGALLGAWAHVLWWVFLTMSSHYKFDLLKHQKYVSTAVLGLLDIIDVLQIRLKFLGHKQYSKKTVHTRFHPLWVSFDLATSSVKYTSGMYISLSPS